LHTELRGSESLGAHTDDDRKQRQAGKTEAEPIASSPRLRLIPSPRNTNAVGADEPVGFLLLVITVVA
jgi:hypothetical protein